MRTERARRAAVFCLVLAALAPAAPAHAGRWVNHIDASMINEIVVHDGLLYMATYGGLLTYDPVAGTFEQYRNDSGLPSNQLRCLTFDTDGNIYAGTADVGVAKFRVKNGTLTLIRALSSQIDGVASNTVNSISAWDDILVYGSTPGAGTIRNDFASATFFERDGLPGPDVFDVMPVGDKVWMATAGGVATLDRLGIIQTVTGSPANSFVLGSDGVDIWVGTNTGVRRYDPIAATWTNLSGNIATLRIRSFFWTGTTMYAGASRDFLRYPGTGTNWTIISPDSIQNRYQLVGGSVGREMKGLAVLPNGDVYLGTAASADLRGPNLMRYDGTHVVNLKPAAPGANNVTRLDIDTDGAVWASFSDFYVGKLMPDGNWVNYNPSIPGIQFPTNQYTNIAFLADSQGHKWFSSLSQPNVDTRPLDELDDGRDANYANDVWVRHALGSGGGDGYGTLRPVRAAEDPVGNRWFLSDAVGASLGWEGINILSRDGTAWFQMNKNKDPRMVGSSVVDVAFDVVDTYVAFLNDGVYRWRNGGYTWNALTNFASDTWTVIVPKGGANGLPLSANIVRIARRSDGRIWIATTEGLYYTNGATLGIVPAYVGISPGIVPGKVQDILLDHDENLWVATDLGLNKIAHDSENDIQTFLTPASFAILSGLRYSLDVISPLANANCLSLAIHPTDDLLYVGTFGGISTFDFSAPPSSPTDLSKVYVYPNPVYTSKGHVALKIANLTGPVEVQIYNLEGELVDSRTVAVNGDVAWDLTTSDGFLASSGKYIVRIIGENGSVQRPIALIR